MRRAGLARLPRRLGQHLSGRSRGDRAQGVDDQIARAARTQHTGQADQGDDALDEDQRGRVGHRPRVTESVGPPEPEEGVAHERATPNAGQRLGRVVAGQPPGLRNLVRRAHVASVSGTQMVIARGFTLVLICLVVPRSLPSSSYGSGLLHPDVERRPRGRLDERRLRGLAHHRSRQRSEPVQTAVRGDHADVEDAVVGGRVGERRDAPDHVSHVADEHAGCAIVEPLLAIDLDPHPHRVTREVPRPGEDIGERTDPILQAARFRVADHERVQPRAGHHTEVLAVGLAEVDRAAGAVQPDADRFLEILRDTQIGCEEVGRARGQDRDMDAAAGQRIERALHRAVTAPDEDQVRALVAESSRLLRDLLGLHDLDPGRVGEPVARERAPQLRQPAVERLGRVREDRDRGHTATPGSTTLGARAGSSRRSARATAAAALTRVDDDGAYQAPDREDDAPEHIGRVMHPPVQAGQRDEDRHDHRQGPEQRP